MEFTLKYTIPDVVTEPGLDMSEKSIKIIAINIIEIAKSKKKMNILFKFNNHFDKLNKFLKT